MDMNVLKFKKFLILTFLLFIGFALQSQVSSEIKQKTITVGWPYKIDEVKPLCDYIAQKTNMKVTVVKVRDLNDMRERMAGGTLDICFLNGFQYVLLSGESKVAIDPLAVLGKQNGSPSTYHSCIIANTGANVNSINEIRTKAQQLSVMFVKPTSTSGHLAPRLVFSALGLDIAERAFKKVDFAGGHRKTIEAVGAGFADIGACSKVELDFAYEKGVVSKSDVKIIWVSGAIPEGPVVARKALENDTKQKVKSALINLNRDNPNLWNIIHTTWSGAVNASGFVEANDSHYDSIRRTANSMTDLIRILKYYLK